jgi:hypothetical protein
MTPARLTIANSLRYKNTVPDREWLLHRYSKNIIDSVSLNGLDVLWMGPFPSDINLMVEKDMIHHKNLVPVASFQQTRLAGPAIVDIFLNK